MLTTQRTLSLRCSHIIPLTTKKSWCAYTIVWRFHERCFPIFIQSYRSLSMFAFVWSRLDTRCNPKEVSICSPPLDEDLIHDAFLFLRKFWHAHLDYMNTQCMKLNKGCLSCLPPINEDSPHDILLSKKVSTCLSPLSGALVQDSPLSKKVSTCPSLSTQVAFQSH